MHVTIPAFGKQLQAESPGLMGGSGGALLGGPHTIDMHRRYVASNDKSESTRQAAKNIYVRVALHDSGLSSVGGLRGLFGPS